MTSGLSMPTDAPKKTALAVETRRCSRCRESKPLDDFRLDSRGYFRSHCKPCALEVTNEWRARRRAERS